MLPFTSGHPVRINRILVGIRVLSVSTIVRDDDFREAKQNRVWSDPVIVVGQWIGGEPTFKLERTMTGDSVPTTAHIVFRFKELDAVQVGFLPKKGDRVVSVNSVPCDWTIIKSSKGSPLYGNRMNSFARPILLHVDLEATRKKYGSI
jgi:hypothetical protein